MSLRALVLQTLADHRLWDFRSRLVLAVSGGCDSMVMLNVLHALAPDPRSQLVVAHVDHNVRPGSANDAAFVEAAANTLEIPFICRKLTRGQAPSGLSSEAYWRRERYAILLDIRKQVEASAVATAHTATDHLETVLMRLTVGAGPRGFLGIRIRRNDGVIRPMLGITREEIISYAESTGIRWREDESNRDMRRPRNSIRSRVIPVLRTINPDVDRAVLRGSQLLAEEDALLSMQAHTILGAAGWKSLIPAMLNPDAFLSKPDSLVLRCAAALFDALIEVSGGRAEFSHIRALALCLSGKAHACRLPGGGQARRIPAGLLIIPGIPAEARIQDAEIPFATARQIGAYNVVCEEVPVPLEQPDDSETRVILDTLPVRIRLRRSNDRMAAGSQPRLSEYWRIHKVPAPLRALLPVVADSGSRIVWTAEAFKPSSVFLEESGGKRYLLTCRPVWAIR
ncbi:tRNA lysidine(34) synthetase TilS [bacterium]|nr:tRNA lysidine(34) synthetase TilS [candidate division CSSED10-310 bacterium]